MPGHGGQVQDRRRNPCARRDQAAWNVTRAQALEAGVSRHQFDARIRSGELILQYRGVYRVGHEAPSVEARYLAAVLACGERALLCGPAAGYLFGLLKGRPPPPEVVAPTERRVPGLKTRRSRAAVEGTTWRGIPVTTVPRTLVGLAAERDEDALARACHEAGVRYGTTPAQVDTVLDRRPRVPGVAKLRRIRHGDVRVTLSKLERLVLQLLQNAGLPPAADQPAGEWSASRLPLVRAAVDRRA